MDFISNPGANKTSYLIFTENVFFLGGLTLSGLLGYGMVWLVNPGMVPVGSLAVSCNMSLLVSRPCLISSWRPQCMGKVWKFGIPSHHHVKFEAKSCASMACMISASTCAMPGLLFWDDCPEPHNFGDFCSTLRPSTMLRWFVIWCPSRRLCEARDWWPSAEFPWNPFAAFNTFYINPKKNLERP